MRDLAHHQKLAVGRLAKWWKCRSQGDRHGFVAMPTGSGKTHTAVHFVVHEILAKKRHPCVVWVAHSDFLLKQAQGEFERQLAAAGLTDQIAMGRARGDGDGADANLVFAMLQTLARGEAIKKIKRAGEVDLVVFDEFHRLAAKTWSTVPEKFQRSKIRTLGLSATPFRTTFDKTQVLRDLLPHRIYSVGMTELIRARFLADPTFVRVMVKNAKPVLSPKDLRHLRTFHRLSEEALSKIANQAGRDHLILSTYRTGKDRYKSTIIFACSVEHAESLARLFSKAGVPARSICGSSKSEMNVENLNAFRRGEFAVATSVLLLTEGVDAPICRTVFLARPTESPVLLMQMIGRAMRGQDAGGAATCTIVDFVDNLGNEIDLSASHLAFVRDRDERIKKLVNQPPRVNDQGLSIGLLLRIREFLNERLIQGGGDVDVGDVLREEVAGWVEYWDGEVRRYLLLPRAQATQILESLVSANREGAELDPVDLQGGAAELARNIYDDDELDRYGVSEEDFVGMAAAAATDPASMKFHALSGPAAIGKHDAQRLGAVNALEAVARDIEATGMAPEFATVFDAIAAAIASDRPGSFDAERAARPADATGKRRRSGNIGKPTCDVCLKRVAQFRGRSGAKTTFLCPACFDREKHKYRELDALDQLPEYAR